MKIKLTEFYLISACAVLLLSGCQKEANVTSQLTTVRPFTAVSKAYENSVSYTGYVSADELKRFSFELSGKIDSVSVEKGDTVKAGQILAVLDKDTVQTAVDNAEENVKLAQSSVTLAQSNITLAQNKVDTAQSAIDEINIGIEAAETTLSKIQTSIDSEQINLEKIKSTYNSSIAKIQLNYDNYKKTYEDTQKLYDSGVVTKDTLDQAKLAFDTVSEELSGTQTTMNSDVSLEEKKIESLEQDYSLQESQIKDMENKLEQAKQQKQAAEISLEQAKTSLSQAKTSLSQAQLALDDSKNNLSKTNLISTIDGYVAQTPMKAGEVTSAGTPVVVVKSGSEIVNISVPAEDYSKFSVGMNTRLTQNNSEYYGKITSIDLYPDETTRTYNIEITPAEKTDFAMASLVNVEVSLDTYDLVSIPLSSILNIDGIDYVYVITQNENNENIITSKQITIIRSDGENVFVSGIESGTVIASDEVKNLYDNQIVNIMGA